MDESDSLEKWVSLRRGMEEKSRDRTDFKKALLTHPVSVPGEEEGWQLPGVYHFRQKGSFSGPEGSWVIIGDLSYVLKILVVPTFKAAFSRIPAM